MESIGPAWCRLLPLAGAQLSAHPGGGKRNAVHPAQFLFCSKLHLEAQTSGICYLFIDFKWNWSQAELFLKCWSGLSLGFFFACGSSLIYTVLCSMILVAAYSSDWVYIVDWVELHVDWIFPSFKMTRRGVICGISFHVHCNCQIVSYCNIHFMLM